MKGVTHSQYLVLVRQVTYVSRLVRSMATVDTSILKLEDCHQADTLTQLLSLLFEPTPELQSLLVPSVLLRLTARQTPPRSYEELIDICQQVAEGWTWEQKAGFIAGHPMIGEVKTVGLSGKEQGTETRPIVLARSEKLLRLCRETSADDGRLDWPI